MKEFFLNHKKTIAAVLVALGVAGAWLGGALPLDEAMKQIGSIISQEASK
jgi:hypothetical protein